MKTVTLNFYEAKKLTEEKELIFLSEIKGDILVDRENHHFSFSSDTEVDYPAIKVLENEKRERVKVNGVRFWNYCGDATHSSVIIPMPLDLEVDDDVQIYCSTNTSQFKELRAKVNKIDVIRDMNDENNKWFWMIHLTR